MLTLNTLLNLLTAGSYALATLMLVRRFKQPVQGARARILWLVWLGLLLHTAGLLVYGWQHGMVLNFALASSVFAWQVVLLLALAALRRPLENLGLLILPMSAVCAVLPSVLPLAELAPQTPHHGLQIHIFSALLGYALLTLAAAQAVLLVYQDRQLHQRRATALLRVLPPLETMEAFLFQIVTAGLCLLTLALASGFLFVEDVFAQHLVHKTVFSMIAWLVFAIVLLGRHLSGWRGRKAMRYVMGGYASLVLAYFGSKLVLEVLLGKQWG